MAVGDADDIVSRLQQQIPFSWFPRALVPICDAALAGIATTLSFLYSLLAYVRLQTRISTATDGFLDLIAADFFGDGLPRLANQGDASYRARILSSIFRERGTRRAITQVLEQLTGLTPVVFEPARPADTGGYGYACGYGVAGGYGSLLLPLQGFVIAYRPPGSGIPNVIGYGASAGGYGQASQIEYASLSMIQDTVTDADIYAAVDGVRVEGTTVWVAIATPP